MKEFAKLLGFKKHLPVTTDACDTIIGDLCVGKTYFHLHVSAKFFLLEFGINGRLVYFINSDISHHMKILNKEQDAYFAMKEAEFEAFELNTALKDQAENRKSKIKNRSIAL